jgi:hypothetical protein
LFFFLFFVIVFIRNSLTGVTTPVFEEGSRVEGNMQGKGKWLPGTITKVRYFDTD